MSTNPVNERTVPPIRISPVQAVPVSVKPIVMPGVAAAAPAVKIVPPSAVPQQRVTPPRRVPRIMGLKHRHAVVVASFAVLVIAPLFLVASYLTFVAHDQYHSRAAFSIRSEQANAAVSGLLGALTQVSSGSASDADILYDYIRSQEIVEDIQKQINLTAIYQRAPGDWYFSLSQDATIEDLFNKWNSMVQVSHESTNGILQIQAEAFSPEDAQLVVETILAKSSDLVNKLSDAARNDAIKFSTEMLTEAEANVFGIRRKLTEFRRANKIVDPTADAAGQLGILNALQSELATALVDRDSLASFAQEDDPRLSTLDTRIQSITARIEAERNNLSGTLENANKVDIYGEYEDLRVQQEFANAAYTQALAGLASARADGRRQARYLAVHVQPTLAQTSLYPRKFLLLVLTGLFGLLAWAISMLLYYNVRDNR